MYETMKAFPKPTVPSQAGFYDQISTVMTKFGLVKNEPWVTLNNV